MSLRNVTAPVLLLIAAAGVRTAAPFRAAAVKAHITPATPQVLLGYNPRTLAGVHDRIYHRVLALDYGRTQLYLVSSDTRQLVAFLQGGH